MEKIFMQHLINNNFNMIEQLIDAIAPSDNYNVIVDIIYEAIIISESITLPVTFLKKYPNLSSDVLIRILTSSCPERAIYIMEKCGLTYLENVKPFQDEIFECLAEHGGMENINVLEEIGFL